MEGEEIIRAYMLEPGDTFRMWGSLHKVLSKRNGKIHYGRARVYGWDSFQTMGANSREKLILITNKTKQNEHQN